jgi:hypothetical protein
MTDISECQNAVHTKRLRAICPSCDRNDWATLDELVEIRGLVEADQGGEAFAMVCRFCGFLRLHAAKQLLHQD